MKRYNIQLTHTKKLIAIGALCLTAVMLIWSQVGAVVVQLPKTVWLASESVNVRVSHLKPSQIKTQLLTADGQATDIVMTTAAIGSDTEITLIPPRSLQPGRYTLKITDPAGRSYTQDFSWGVLAINLTKSVYSPGQTADIAMAVLNDHGAMVCDANLQLTITNPDGQTEHQTTGNKQITVNPECQIKDITQKPDYQAEYILRQAGTYKLVLEAQTAQGNRSIATSLTVQEPIQDALVIERQSATRIYPIKAYDMILQVTAQRDIKGEFSETIPNQFIVNPSDKGQAFKYQSFDQRGGQNYQTTTLHWPIDLKSGETVTLAYNYDAPDTSPNFFLVGPAKLTQDKQNLFTEPRSWQIAVDAVVTALEQQINITDQSYTVSSGIASPTNNPLGLIRWEDNGYSNAEAYLEATTSNTVTGSIQGAYGNNGLDNRANSIFCPSDDDCKIAYNDSGNNDLRFKDCDNEACSLGTITLLDGNTGCTLVNCSTTSVTGMFTSIFCPSANDCKIAYYDVTDTALSLADCDDATCSSGTTTKIDGSTACGLTGCSTAIQTGGMPSIKCSSGTDCKIGYGAYLCSIGCGIGGPLRFADCDDATCSTGTISVLDGAAGCVLTNCTTSGLRGGWSSMECPTTNDCKISYYDATNTALLFADCDNATCSTGTISVLDGNTGCSLTNCATGGANGQFTSLNCPATGDCKISYYDATNTALLFADCDNATCSTGTISVLDGNTGCSLTNCSTSNGTSGQSLSMNCRATNDCKVAFYGGSGDLLFADCDDATCSTGTISVLDGNTGCTLLGCTNATVGRTNAIFCSTDTNCKIAYYDNTSTNIKMADCDNATCSTGTTVKLDAGNITSNVGEYTSITCLSANDCKIAYSNTADGTLRLKNCSDSRCSQGTISIIDGSANCMLLNCTVGQNVGRGTSIYCLTTEDCKVVYYDLGHTALLFADCDNATCSSGTVNILDGAYGCSPTNCDSNRAAGSFSGIYCPTTDDCKIAYSETTTTNADFFFIDCDDATCSSGTTTLIDGNTGCALTGCSTTAGVPGRLTIQCFSSTDCKIAYPALACLFGCGDSTPLRFADCDNATCSSGTINVLDGGSGCKLTGCSTSGRGAGASMSCLATDDCKIAYYDNTNTAMLFADCNTATCSSGTITVLDGYTGCVLTGCNSSGSSGIIPSIKCLTANDCKVIYRDTTNTALIFADCDDATCSSGTTTTIDGNTGCSLTGCDTSRETSSYLALSCPTSAGCKVATYNTAGANLLVADCDDATCSSGAINIADTGGPLTWLQLYSSSGAPVGDPVSLTVNSNSYTLLRTPTALSLTDYTDYTIRAWSSISSPAINTKVISAKLVVLQSNAGGIANTQSAIELGSSQTTTGTSYTPLTSPKIYYYDTDNFSGTVTTYFEATLKGSAGGVTASAALSSDPSCASTVAGSEVTVTGTTWTLARSSAITVPSDAEYFTCFRTSSGTGSMANAKLLINLSGALDKVQTVHQLLPTAATDNDATYTSQLPLNRLTTANYAGDGAYYYLESVMKTSSGTGYARLFNNSDTADITDSELSTTSTNFERKYTDNLASNLTTDKNYLVQLKGGASSAVTVANSWLIIQVSLAGATQNGGAAPVTTPSTDQKLKGGNWWNDGARQPLSLD